MKLKKLIVMSATAGLVAGLVACGGSDGAAPAAAGGTKIVTGAITAFGSVYVNGVEYDTDSTAVYVEGSQASESDLRVGMMVTVKESGDGVAASIHFGDDLEGFVISNNVAVGGTGTLNVMGQIVSVDANTIFESKVEGVTTAAMIDVGNIVEVSGSSDGTGKITATRLEVKSEDLTAYLDTHDDVEVKGVVASHDSAALTFSIGSLVVSYASANLDDMPAGSWDGLYVEVKSVEPLNSDGQLVASKVELENGGSKSHAGDEDDEVEVSGAVTAVTADSVTVNGQTYLLDSNTTYEHGVAADLIEGAMVEVEGKFNASGDLVASEIEFAHDEMDDELKGTVASITTTGMNEGTIMVNGLTIIVNNDTIMHDSSPMHEMSFNLSMLAVDDTVEVHVVANGDGTFTAIKLEREMVAAVVVAIAM